MPSKVSSEPVLTWAAGHVTINTVQLLAIHMPAWLHVIVFIILSVGAAIGSRQQVTPAHVPDLTPKS